MTNYFKEGPILGDEIASIANSLNQNKAVGGVGIFLGQVRADQKEEHRVQAIEYSCYPEMANPIMNQLLEEIKSKYELLQIEVLHSLGRISCGEYCLMVLTAAAHRRNALDACDELLERLKKEVPVWGKELFENAPGNWKVNT